MTPQIILVTVAAVICVASGAPEPAVTILGQDSPNTLFASQDPSKSARILRLESDSNPDGSFYYTYETENGISARVEGSHTKGADSDNDIQSVKGQYSYTGPDGVQYTVQYIADENGFQAFGAHLPTPPPIPEAIHRSLSYNAAHPEEDSSIIAASPALAPTSILSPQALQPAPFPTKLPPRVVTTSRADPPPSLNKFNVIVTSTPLPPTRPPTLPTLPKPQQQQAQAQLLAQTQLLQQQQLQQQQQNLQPQQFQIQPFQPQQFQPQQFQQQQFQQQPPQFAPQPLQPQQFQVQPFQSQSLQPQQFQIPQFQQQAALNQFSPAFQTFGAQRRTS